MNCPLIVLMGALSHPPAPAPAGALARLDPDARDRVASAAARAPATRRAYAAQWRRFEHWCAGRETDALAAPPAEVASYLAERPERSKLATVRSAAGLADPTKTPLVSDTLRAIARQHARQPGATPRQARALTYDQARELMLAARDRRRRGRGLESEETAARRARVQLPARLHDQRPRLAVAPSSSLNHFFSFSLACCQYSGLICIATAANATATAPRSSENPTPGITSGIASSGAMK